MQPQFTRHVRGGCLRNQKRSLTAGPLKGFVHAAGGWAVRPVGLAVQSGRAGRRRIGCLHEEPSCNIVPPPCLLLHLIPEPSEHRWNQVFLETVSLFALDNLARVLVPCVGENFSAVDFFQKYSAKGFFRICGGPLTGTVYL